MLSISCRSYIKKAIKTLFLAAIAIIILIDPALAASGTITGSVVNIRSGPGINYEIAGNLYQNTKVEVLEKNNDWVKIKTSSLTGWVSSSLINIDAVKQVRVTGDSVNLRSGPSTSTAIVGYALKGDILDLLNDEGEWYKVKNADGTICYIAAYLTEQAANSSGTSPGANQQNSTNQQPSLNNSAPKVYFNNNQLIFDVDPIIDNDRTLVPLRAIFEAMGAIVDWNQATKTVTAIKDNTMVVLTIGSTQPTVNGQIWPLDVPAKIIQDRTLAPLRFVGEAFGGTVNWDSATRTVYITSNNNNSANNPNPPQVSSVYVSEALINLRSGPSTSYAAISSAQQGEKLDVLAQQDGWYQVSRGGNTAWVASWVVNTSPVAITPGNPSNNNNNNSGNNTPPGNNNSTTVKPGVIPADKLWVSTVKTKNGMEVVIESGSKINPDLIEDGAQVKYIIKNKSVLNTNELQRAIGDGKLKVTSSNQSDSAVIEITMPAGIKYTTDSIDSGKTEILSIPNQIVKVSRQVAGSKGDTIIVYTLGPCDFNSDLQGDTLEVNLKSTAVGLERLEYKYSSPVLDKMVIAQSGNSAKLIISTEDLGDYRVFQTEDDNAINIVLLAGERKNVKRENLVVIDPGHGGKETGAIGFGVEEKDINLAIALKAGEILEEEGINVEYTRTRDTYVGLSERAEIANDLNAALFVCIHSNASTSPSACGTETYYYAPMDNVDLFWQKGERSRLANCIQEELIDALDTVDRGVKNNQAYTVLVKTEMPSVLIEVAFLSNERENDLLTSKNFQKKAAQAIADGILKYLGK
jgi:N-acetylmuramoyl-L-alanine amidase